MKWVKLIWIFWGLVILINFCSCQTHRQWTKKGIEKGWIDTLKKDSVKAFIPSDTVAGDSVISNFVDSLESIIKADCPDVKPETITKIRYVTKKEFIPKYIQVAYRDTTINQKGIMIKISFDGKGYTVEAVAEKQVITRPEKTWKEEAKEFIPCFFMFMGYLFFGLIILYIFLALKKKFKGT